MESVNATSTNATTQTNNQSMANDIGSSASDVVKKDNGTEITGEKEGIHGEKKEPKPKVKKKFVVDKKEIELELDDETTDKYIQKALAADKRFQEARKREQELEQIAQNVFQRRQEAEQFWSALEDNDQALNILINKMGPERFRSLAETFLAPVVQEEILKEKNPLEYELQKTKRELEQERKAKKDREEAEAKAKTENEINEIKTRKAQEYQDAIIKALDSGAIPRNERSISHFVDYMRKLVDRDQEVTEESISRIAQTVKEDKIDDIKWLVSGYQDMAKQALEAKDDNKLIKIGDELISMFGEDMVNLIRRADLAKIRSSQPTVPKQIFDTPKAEGSATKPKGYMSEDDWAEQRRKAALEYDRASKAR